MELVVFCALLLKGSSCVPLSSIVSGISARLVPSGPSWRRVGVYGPGMSTLISLECIVVGLRFVLLSEIWQGQRCSHLEG